jgi:hypothetical protein
MGSLAIALWVSGCPAPTGRRRGPLDTDAGACSQLTQRPVSGEACTSVGASCDFEAPCPTRFGQESFVQTERCSCIGGRWSCAAVDACFERLPDGGISCPLTDDPSSLTFACGEQYRGRTCQLPLFVCPDRSRPELSCTCDGNLWQCEPVTCRSVMPDAGVTARAGEPCRDDSQCGGLSCDTSSVAGGHCTGSCMNTAQQSAEQMQCGGAGTTCLSTSDVDALCVRSCRAAGGASGCRQGFVCTGLWFAQSSGEPDRTGCFPFCTTNADCAAGIECNPRTGRCGEMPENPMGLADGMPCTLSDPSSCRGTCFQVSESGSTGVCGSFINVERGASCLDGMGVEPLAPSGDNFGLCIFRRCDESICCPRGLVCEDNGGGGGFCTVDDPGTPNTPCAAADGGASDAGDASADSRG